MKVRRILIVVEGPQSALGLVRGSQYNELFQSHPQYNVTYIARTSLHSGQGRPPWYHRLTRRLCFGPLYRALVWFQERRINRRSPEFDIVYVLGVPAPALFENLCRNPNTCVILDVVDGLWLPYHRQFGWQQFEKMLENASAVICKSDYIAEYARQYNPRVFVVPDSPQLDVFDRWRSQVQRESKQIRLGWIGSIDSAGALFSIWEPLEKLFRRHSNLHLRILGGTKQRIPPFENVKFSVLPNYNQEQMVREVLQMDIGLFPLFHVDDSLARGASKPRIYMSGEAVAVCENFGASRDLIEDGVNGVLADTPEEWFEKLDGLIQNPGQRDEIARRGLETIRKDFSKQACFERLVQVFDRL